jgi:hypothetical protein
MRPVAENVEADPLQRMKNTQYQSKNDIVDGRKNIAEQFSHSVAKVIFG